MKNDKKKAMVLFFPTDVLGQVFKDVDHQMGMFNDAGSERPFGSKARSHL